MTERERLYEKAKSYGIAGRSKMRLEDLRFAIERHEQTLPPFECAAVSLESGKVATVRQVIADGTDDKLSTVERHPEYFLEEPSEPASAVQVLTALAAQSTVTHRRPSVSKQERAVRKEKRKAVKAAKRKNRGR